MVAWVGCTWRYTPAVVVWWAWKWWCVGVVCVVRVAVMAVNGG